MPNCHDLCSWTLLPTFPKHCHKLNSLKVTQTGLSRTSHVTLSQPSRHVEMVCVRDSHQNLPAVKVSVMEFGNYQVGWGHFHPSLCWRRHCCVLGRQRKWYKKKNQTKFSHSNPPIANLWECAESVLCQGTSLGQIHQQQEEWQRLTTIIWRYTVSDI